MNSPLSLCECCCVFCQNQRGNCKKEKRRRLKVKLATGELDFDGEFLVFVS